MIIQPTTLVLGAGASVDFGYPTGAGLRERILALDTGWIQWIAPASNETSWYTLFEDFKVEFRMAPTTTIDAFLEDRPAFKEIGTRCIAAALLRDEKPEMLNQSWHTILFAAMRARELESEERPLRVVTFNYDRSLEAFLHRSLMAAYGMNRSEASATLRRNLDIVHVYGQLDEIPDYSKGENRGGREYGASDPLFIDAAAKDLRLVNREQDQTHNAFFENARRMIAGAEFIAFIGFGFDRVNLERLQLSNVRYSKIFFCTGKGIYDGKRALIRSMFPQHAFYFGDPDHKAKEFLNRTDFFSWAASRKSTSRQLLRALDRKMESDFSTVERKQRDRPFEWMGEETAHPE